MRGRACRAMALHVICLAMSIWQLKAMCCVCCGRVSDTMAGACLGVFLVSLAAKLCNLIRT